MRKQRNVPGKKMHFLRCSLSLYLSVLLVTNPRANIEISYLKVCAHEKHAVEKLRGRHDLNHRNYIACSLVNGCFQRKLKRCFPNSRNVIDAIGPIMGLRHCIHVPLGSPPESDTVREKLLLALDLDLWPWGAAHFINCVQKNGLHSNHKQACLV